MMKCFRFRLWAALAISAVTAVAAHAAKPMNVVVILADDLGWTDLACFGSKLNDTPNIDKLARDGMKFTQAYSACTVCSPTRAALMTGKYPARLHVTDWIPGMPPENPKLLVPDWTKYLALEEKTIADDYRAAGYGTASIGKWHLGGEEYYPEKHGFDMNLGGTDQPNTKSYFAPYKIPTLPEGPDGEYITDRLGAEAVKYIEQHKDKPFFLYLPHFAVHLPVQGKQAMVKKYRAKIAENSSLLQTNAGYAAMTESLDDAVGAVRRKLEELKLADNTVVIFASDNGGRIPTTSNAPLRGGKGSCYEGGTRVPLIVYWPGVTKPGSASDTPVITMDLLPTLMEITGQKALGSTGMDGVSLVPVLKGDGKLKRDEIFWHYPHYQHYQLSGTTPYSAIRKGDYKLIEYHDDMRVELYDLVKDVSEAHNLATEMPDKTKELRDRLHAWRREVGAQMPTKNPNYDPTKPEHDKAANKQQKKSEG